MKYRSFTIISFCLLLLGAGCKDDNASVIEAELSSECVFKEGRTVDTYENEQGVITFVQESNHYAIADGRMGNGRELDFLVPCNLPDTFKKDKLKVIFSGELKKIYGHEDWGAHPFQSEEVEDQRRLTVALRVHRVKS